MHEYKVVISFVHARPDGCALGHIPGWPYGKSGTVNIYLIGQSRIYQVNQGQQFGYLEMKPTSRDQNALYVLLTSKCDFNYVIQNLNISKEY
ncbi:hypothetical protein AVEN_146460-1 [Araneus ventricosus]|uniref:Uncharacterized protein n=1 Tax=Araneus ventricosus TaxID=182803 RepID=A0A4Y2WF77_ARAVE|nr:hypothetical protein AVEN_130232-1 [Araneus ventricosus]GBO34717.1 hypothetical protein AVEN_146460-1 [Araneus ventricosus]